MNWGFASAEVNELGKTPENALHGLRQLVGLGGVFDRFGGSLFARNAFVEPGDIGANFAFVTSGSAQFGHAGAEAKEFPALGAHGDDLLSIGARKMSLGRFLALVHDLRAELALGLEEGTLGLDLAALGHAKKRADRENRYEEEFHHGSFRAMWSFSH